MKTAIQALTWEFWCRGWGGSLWIITCMVGISAFLFVGLRLELLPIAELPVLGALHTAMYFITTLALAAVSCEASGSRQFRYNYPISTWTMIAPFLLNGAIMVGGGYLVVAGTVNLLFSAGWPLVNPALAAGSVYLLCEALASFLGAHDRHRNSLVIVMYIGIGVGGITVSGSNPERLWQVWQETRVMDWLIAIALGTGSCLIAQLGATRARRGQTISLARFTQWLRQRIRFRDRSHFASARAAECWLEWTTRGFVMPVGAASISTILSLLFLTGWFDWPSASGAILGWTWVLMMVGVLGGMFLGHVGERFDFLESTATRPLSDTELADVKLWNVWTSVGWTWVVWCLGMVVALACLAIAGHAPHRWDQIIPPGTPPTIPLLVAVLTILASWTLTSMAASLVVLRPVVLLPFLSSLPAGALLLGIALFSFPQHTTGIMTFVRWTWLGASIVATIAIYATAIRLRLLSITRVTGVVVGYLLLLALSLGVIRVLPPSSADAISLHGLLVSTCLLPFVAHGAMPLFVWWNRHR